VERRKQVIEGDMKMFNWMSERGKSAWLLAFFLVSMLIPTAIPGIYIMNSLPHPYGVVGFLYLGISVFGIFWLWDKYYFKR